MTLYTVYRTSIYFWLKKTTFLTWYSLPSPQQHKFLPSCWLSSTCSKSWKLFQMTKKMWSLTCQSNRWLQIPGLSKVKLMEAATGLIKKSPSPLPSSPKSEKRKYSSQMKAVPHLLPLNFGHFFPLMFQKCCLKNCINLKCTILQTFQYSEAGHTTLLSFPKVTDDHKKEWWLTLKIST